jgi:O-antigen/teichoic acid export membrane protein
VRPPPSPANSRIQALLQAALIDRAVVFGVATRVWQLLAAPVTLFLIARHVSPELQGFYYTFGSLLALQSFVELGFYNVILNVASHEWSALRLDAHGSIVGSVDARSRLISLGRLVFGWYAVASLLFVVGVWAAGYVFFGHHPVQGVAWKGPWAAVVCFTGLLLWALPFNSLLEGCNQVETIQRLRLSQALLSSVALWIALVSGAGLWALVVAAAVNVLRDAWLLLVQYRRFFTPFIVRPDGPVLEWQRDLWPMQWRLALSGVVNYFAFSLFNPVMFQYKGAVVAGQMGMTLAMVYGLQSLGVAMLSPKIPTFGMLIARRDFRALDRLWLRTSVVSLLVCLAGGAAVWTAIWLLRAAGAPIAGRLLAPGPAALLLAGMLLMQVSQCETAYLRAHKQEPIVVLSVTSSLAIGLLVWLLGSRYGPTGAAAGYAAVAAVAVVWETAIWARCRAVWHADPPVPATAAETMSKA